VNENCIRQATFSPCSEYRYVLRRTWNHRLPAVLFVALNPSTADGVADDPTIRRCIGFARKWGFGKLIVANLFALRSTDPSALKFADDPIGPRNDWWLRRLSKDAELTIAAWGMHGVLHDRANCVLPMLRSVHHLGRTRDGHPRHLLYLKGSVLPTRF
jgi:hypothetical protein